MSEQSTDRGPDPYIQEAVQHVANRYGVGGLEELIAEAQRELADARRALEELREE